MEVGFIKHSAYFGRELFDAGANVVYIGFRQGEFSADDGGIFRGESCFASGQSILHSLGIFEKIVAYSEVNQIKGIVLNEGKSSLIVEDCIGELWELCISTASVVVSICVIGIDFNGSIVAANRILIFF
jgi:hypothetical protein